MRVFIAFALVVGISAYSQEEIFQTFATWTAEHNKEYDSSAEFKARMAIFGENLVKISQDNAALAAAGEDEVYGLGPFADLTAAEFKKTYLSGYEYTPANETELVRPTAPAADIDWSTRGALTPIKDQGQCGSCWAHSATEAIESYLQIAGQPLVSLSVQQINSCDKTSGGCNGGSMESAFSYVKSAGGIESEAAYPYTSGHGQTGVCRFDSSKVVAKISGYKRVSTGESNLASALMNGPPSIAVAAESWQHYTGGILSSCTGRLDHGVQAVGQTADAWKIRNSWGPRWGESGFIRVKKGGNLCSLSNDVSYPTA